MMCETINFLSGQGWFGFEAEHFLSKHVDFKQKKNTSSNFGHVHSTHLTCFDSSLQNCYEVSQICHLLPTPFQPNYQPPDVSNFSPIIRSYIPLSTYVVIAAYGELRMKYFGVCEEA